ncbi:TPA: hypothetical protein DIV55_03940 [Patescibacteria group bacterium]|uniref:dTDP-4-dehydrorhamnose reductase n=1 Tax=Candidatus Gottesmanbacteria bacterium GW2011_GWA1_43_11 TaxID=1618436 RepID=A0A0G1CJV1_9BACT|nr:MAG: dTDP-4-dehydrorhamnose reductase [Candidatus Gottesmanbacteria bacterium GW2011_GWA1_43_11]HCS78871.1 hypothetical protein [Patescibacteria group bacterium]
MAKALSRWYNTLVAKKILITGVVSLLGSALTRVFRPNHTVIATFHKSAPTHLSEQSTIPLDITNAQMVTELVKKIAPDVIIHLAATSNLEYCETHPQAARLLNVMGTEHVATAAELTQAHLVFLSSSMVFSGTNAPYIETAIPQPVNVYGQTKYEAEQLITQKLTKFTIIRAASLLGWQLKTARTNDLTYYLPLLQQSKPISLVNDRFFNPLSAITAAQAIRKIIEQEKFGTYHLGGLDRVTRYSLVKTIAEVFRIKQTNLLPVPSSFFPNLAPRPTDSMLTTLKMETKLGIYAPTIKAELLKLFQEAKTS